MYPQQLGAFAGAYAGLGLAALSAVAADSISKSRRFQLFGRMVSRVNTTQRCIALTFDDGPNPPFTERILDVLSAYNARATFYLLGRYVDRHKGTASAIVGAGHEVGNHGYSHRRLVMRSPEFIKREIAVTDRALRTIGVTGEITFRAPNARKLLVLPYTLASMRKLHVLFDVLPEPSDYFGAPADVVSDFVLSRVRPGSIVVLHDGTHDGWRDRANVVAATRLVLQRLIEQDYTFLRVDELLRLSTTRVADGTIHA
ncbi:MAG: polysaccharide deacetylase family protein [candidate division WOR-3 bacterium]|nr:MAG: polysaccharide deacetylase family protein [candidate division WOR-3 bacterium]